MKSNECRCAGCGKVIEPDAAMVTVLMGKNTQATESTEAPAKKKWGDFHRLCFERAIDSPATALAEIRRLSRQTTVVREPAKEAAKAGKARSA